MKKIRINLDRCLGCKACEVACAKEHSSSGSLAEAVRERPRPLSRIKVQKGIKVRDEEERRPPFGESKKKLPEKKVYALRCRHCERPRCVDACISGALRKTEEGTVIHDPEKCVGCWMCIMACPFGAIKRDPARNIIVKCDLCPHREIPACVEACKTGAIEVIDDQGPRDEMVKEKVKETG
ncbi:MAG: 4Fe-4S dicluster domain-containing protein [Methanomassiliicoccales archaeon]